MSTQLVLYWVFVALFLSIALTLAWRRRDKEIRSIIDMYAGIDPAKKELGIDNGSNS